MDAKPQWMPEKSPARARVEPLLLTTEEAARALAVSARTLWALTNESMAIPCVRIGRSVRYDPADLKTWIATQKAVAAVSEPVGA